MSIFAERLRALRISHNVSQGRLAKKLHYGYTAIANYESGRNEPSIPDLCKIADFFDVSVDYLVGRAENMMSHKSPELHEKLTSITPFDLLMAIERSKNEET